MGDIMDKYLTIVNFENEYNAEDFADFQYVHGIEVNYPDEGEETFIERETYNAYLELQKYLKKKGIPCSLNSAGRTVKAQEITQKEIFDEQFAKFKKDHTEEEAKALAQKYIDDTVAKPGHSEHHTGLAIDVCVKMLGNNAVTKTIAKGYNKLNAAKNYEFLDEIAHKFGFIVRYTAGNSKDTGVKKPEPWHLRYVGKEHAQAYYENAKNDPTYSFEKYTKELTDNVGVGL